ncbi:MAG TPA: DUF2085 domain-containing protein [Candidatus Eremiobacteraeota bacterium]|nr:MAG: hypothetical protein BWY64_02326 [bacterium ADurb.Bin363]HPZ09026.1 DUF2085 domain-containing protein [Candidatus Eremiobacteraeota bacterium]
MYGIFDLFLDIWYNFIGYSACHQIADRTIAFDGRLLFVCCRCSGIYTGYFISYLFICFTSKKDASYFPSKSVIVTGSILASFIFFDVASVILGFRHGANDIRVITGLFAGMALPFLVVPWINRLLLASSGKKERSIDGILAYFMVVILNLLAFLMFTSGQSFLFWPFFIIIASGLILLYVNLNTIFLLFFFRLVGCNKPVLAKIISLSCILFLLEMIPVYVFYKISGIK